MDYVTITHKSYRKLEKKKAAAQYVAFLAFRLRPMTVTVMWAPN